jgi:SOS-response transcriptional repressor LexA
MSTAATGAGALTARQLEVLSFLYGHARDRGYQPDIREIAAGIGAASPNGAMGHLILLEKKGFVRPTGMARGVEMIRRPDGTKFEGFADKP